MENKIGWLALAAAIVGSVYLLFKTTPVQASNDKIEIQSVQWI